ncbi:MAG: DNA polymerase III subunit gamma/tau, partial [Planctomycetes bacterium]|nr:DNA polymerase III subunit gamma/tau [Planctomycetota bacterium]
MSYEVFTLKYRPKTFSDVVGQRSVAETLKRAVQQGRVANAYLLCGSRGVGKTSMARILAKALNCAAAKDGEPCNVCEICRAISKGEDIDVVEIDGASNRGIDDIRSIRDSAGYVPSRSPFKIYIIDEVHMLTIQAFNALLKVLEEPPPHVRFFFATTDPNSLPDTILSRCQRHEFRRISEADIVERLTEICRRESLTAPDEVLQAIASKAEGGLRDSVSLLDQVVSYAGTEVQMADLERAIGMLPRERIEGLLRAMTMGDAPAILSSLEEAFWSGFDPQELLAQFTESLRELMVWHADEARVPDARARAFFEELAAAGLGPDRVHYLLKLFLNTRGDIRRAGHERIQIELACLKAARSTEMLPVQGILDRLDAKSTSRPLNAAVPSVAVAAPRAAAPSSVPEPAPEPAPHPAPTPPTTTGRSVAPLTLEAVTKQWESICQDARAKSAMVAGAMAQARPRGLDGDRLLLEVGHGKRFLIDQLHEPRAQEAACGKQLNTKSARSATSAAVRFSSGKSSEPA